MFSSVTDAHVFGSLSSNSAIIAKGYSVLPREFSTEAYRYIFANPGQIIDAYKVTLFVVIVGTFLSLFLITMTAYVLYRKEFPYRNIIAFYFYFTTLFSGGLVAYYILTIRYLYLKNTLVALILPGIFNVFNTFVMRTFMSTTIPYSLIESAKLDGAGDFQIYRSVVLPLMKPALASIGLFITLNYWNDWWNAMLFIDKSNMMPLQYVLYRVLSSAESFARNASNIAGVRVTMPSESMKLALTVVVTGPIVFVYPFVQKYFVQGIMIGSVKG
ncbi:sugar ABC transporter permease [Clostridia bacterium]|nr:sugar ABC transporter permease [Clostridia bacterium]